MKIHRDQSVGGLPLLPYSSMIVNCVVWVTYGLLKSEPKVWQTNSFGLVLGTYYFAMFHRNCKKGANNLPGTASQHIQAMTVIITFTFLVAATMAKEGAAEIIGKAGVVFCVLLFASPLAALRTVIQTGSAKTIPLPFTVATVINCVLWSVFGLLDRNDFNIYAPNLLGLFFGIVQLMLIGWYGDGTSAPPGLPS
mmetsp:Transcript_33565/g.68544  ORF Transcript_33565/g.68544 Transcript_33565/m.68544 type:complete len:195 (-) Transcript_33565:214-798(-)